MAKKKFKMETWHWIVVIVIIIFVMSNQKGALKQGTGPLALPGCSNTCAFNYNQMPAPDCSCYQPNPTTKDFDGDGIPDNQDPDDDNDGFSDEEERAAGTNPRDAGNFPGEEGEEIDVVSCLFDACGVLPDDWTGMCFEGVAECQDNDGYPAPVGDEWCEEMYIAPAPVCCCPSQELIDEYNMELACNDLVSPTGLYSTYVLADQGWTGVQCESHASISCEGSGHLLERSRIQDGCCIWKCSLPQTEPEQSFSSCKLECQNQNAANRVLCKNTVSNCEAIGGYWLTAGDAQCDSLYETHICCCIPPSAQHSCDDACGTLGGTCEISSGACPNSYEPLGNYYCETFAQGRPSCCCEDVPTCDEVCESYQATGECYDYVEYCLEDGTYASEGDAYCGSVGSDDVCCCIQEQQQDTCQDVCGFYGYLNGICINNCEQDEYHAAEGDADCQSKGYQACCCV